ncbi:MAG: hypothetical protein LC126_28535 [Bryobacterales bacterium]|nr:hypothetical protein [Bryobacterales bacterium]
MGAVYHVVDEMVDRDVAIKSLLPQIAHPPGTLERFRAEAVALAKLNSTTPAWPPFIASFAKVANTSRMPPPSLAARGVAVPEAIEWIVQTALARQTQQRFESAAAMRAHLKPYLPAEATGPAAPPAGATSKDIPQAGAVHTRASRLPSRILLAGLGLALRQVIIETPVPHGAAELPPPPRVETAPAKPAGRHRRVPHAIRTRIVRRTTRRPLQTRFAGGDRTEGRSLPRLPRCR